MPPTLWHGQRTGEVMETVSVVIPTLNEGRSIAKVIDGVPVADLSQSGLETVVTDGQSTEISYRARADRPKLASLRDGVKIGLFLCKRRLRQPQLNGLNESGTEGTCQTDWRETDARH